MKLWLSLFVFSVLILPFSPAECHGEGGEDKPESFINEGGSAAFESKYELAIRQYKEALEKDPYNFEVKRALVAAYIYVGDFKQALKEQEEIIKVLPVKRDYETVAYIYSNMQDYAGVADAYRHVLEYDPTNTDTRRTLSYNLYMARDYDGAAEQLGKVYGSKLLIVPTFLRDRILPFAVLAIVLLLSRNRHLSSVFRVSPRPDGKELPTLAKVFFVTLLLFLLPHFAFNPFSANYFDKVLLTMHFSQSVPVTEPGFLVPLYLCMILCSVLFLKQGGISVKNLFSFDSSRQKQILLWSAIGSSLILLPMLPLIIPSVLRDYLGTIGNTEYSIARDLSSFDKVTISLLTPFAEETYHRGMVFLLLNKYFKVPWSILFSSALFVSSHHFMPDWSHAGAIFLFGGLFCFLVRKTASLWPSLLLHSIWNSSYLLPG